MHWFILEYEFSIVAPQNVPPIVNAFEATTSNLSGHWRAGLNLPSPSSTKPIVREKSLAFTYNLDQTPDWQESIEYK